ncbi:MAG: diacylglycerol kinase family protein [Myxococcota bacterium]
MSRRTCVIVNPASGGGATGRAWAGLQPELEARLPGGREIAFTQRPLHATELARSAVERGFDAIVSVGGDGTLNEVVNGLFAPDPELGLGESVLHPGLELSVVRRGTGGDFARSLELPGRGRGVFAHLDSPRRKPMDLGLCTYRTEDGRVRRRAFANVASFGLTGLVDAKINASGKKLGALSFLGSTVSALYEYRRREVRVAVDGQTLHEGPVLLGAAGNASYFGGGIKITPEADPHDGLLDAVVLTHAGPTEVRKVLDVFSGRHVRWSSARVARGRRVEATSLDGKPCLLDLDGEQPGILDAEFRLVADAVILQLP